MQMPSINTNPTIVDIKEVYTHYNKSTIVGVKVSYDSKDKDDGKEMWFEIHGGQCIDLKFSGILIPIDGFKFVFLEGIHFFVTKDKAFKTKGKEVTIYSRLDITEKSTATPILLETIKGMVARTVYQTEVANATQVANDIARKR